MDKIGQQFFIRDVLSVAPDLLGKYLVRKFDDGHVDSYMITETEAYRGEEDLACHASKGKTARTEVMYAEGGYLYVYLIYGMYWMLNFVTGKEGSPQAVLIRSIEGYEGPGKLTKQLLIDKSFNKEDICHSSRIWVEDRGYHVEYITDERIGIEYAGDLWKSMPWRYSLLSYSLK